MHFPPKLFYNIVVQTIWIVEKMQLICQAMTINTQHRLTHTNLSNSIPVNIQDKTVTAAQMAKFVTHTKGQKYMIL